MKTTAEEKLMRQLEEMIDQSAKTMTRSEFAKSKRDSHAFALDVIRSHKRMIGLWIAMDKRTQKRASRYLGRYKRRAL